MLIRLAVARRLTMHARTEESQVRSPMGKPPPPRLEPAGLRWSLSPSHRYQAPPWPRCFHYCNLTSNRHVLRDEPPAVVPAAGSPCLLLPAAASDAPLPRLRSHAPAAEPRLHHHAMSQPPPVRWVGHARSRECPRLSRLQASTSPGELPESPAAPTASVVALPASAPQLRVEGPEPDQSFSWIQYLQNGINNGSY